MLQAAQLAVFDMGYDQFELVPRDTNGTPQGAMVAVNEALQENVDLILGPLFSEATRAAKSVSARHRINMISFSTDWTLADQHTYVIGFLPFAQVKRITDYAVAQGYGQMGLVAPMDKYGDTVVRAYEQQAQNFGVYTTKNLRFFPGDKNLTAQLQDFSDYTQRKAARETEIARLEALLESNPGNIELTAMLESTQKTDTFGDLPFQAVFMPVGGTQAQILASSLSYYGLFPHIVKRLGTGLWDNEALAREPNMAGAWFAAPSPK